MKVSLTSLPLCDLPFTESSIIAQRTKAGFTKQRDDKVHLEIGTELQNYVTAKGTVMRGNQSPSANEEGGE